MMSMARGGGGAAGRGGGGKGKRRERGAKPAVCGSHARAFVPGMSGSTILLVHPNAIFLPPQPCALRIRHPVGKYINGMTSDARGSRKGGVVLPFGGFEYGKEELAEIESIIDTSAAHGSPGWDDGLLRTMSLWRFPVEEAGAIFMYDPSKSGFDSPPDYIPMASAFKSPDDARRAHEPLVDLAGVGSLSELRCGDALYCAQKRNEGAFPAGMYGAKIGILLSGNKDEAFGPSMGALSPQKKRKMQARSPASPPRSSTPSGTSSSSDEVDGENAGERAGDGGGASAGALVKAEPGLVKAEPGLLGGGASAGALVKAGPTLLGGGASAGAFFKAGPTLLGGGGAPSCSLGPSPVPSMGSWRGPSARSSAPSPATSIGSFGSFGGSIVPSLGGFGSLGGIGGSPPRALPFGMRLGGAPGDILGANGKRAFGRFPGVPESGGGSPDLFGDAIKRIDDCGLGGGSVDLFRDAPPSPGGSFDLFGDFGGGAFDLFDDASALGGAACDIFGDPPKSETPPPAWGSGAAKSFADVLSTRETPGELQVCMSGLSLHDENTMSCAADACAPGGDGAWRSPSKKSRV